MNIIFLFDVKLFYLEYNICHGNLGQTYRSYPQRWALVFSVALLNIANHSHWISYASVNSKAAIFYQVSVDEITR